MALKFNKLSNGNVEVINTDSPNIPILFIAPPLLTLKPDGYINVNNFEFHYSLAQDKDGVSLGATALLVFTAIYTTYFFKVAISALEKAGYDAAAADIANAYDLGVMPLNSVIVGTGAAPIVTSLVDFKTLLGLLDPFKVLYSAIANTVITEVAPLSMLNLTAAQYIGSNIIPINPSAGTIIAIEVTGRMTTVAVAGTGTIAMKIGTNVMGFTNITETLTNSMNNLIFTISLTLVIRSNTTCIVTGTYNRGLTSSTFQPRPLLMITENILVDFSSVTDADRAIDLQYTFGTTGNSLTIQTATLLLKKP